MNIENLYGIFRRWKDGQKTAEIAIQEGLHRSTVYEYIRAFQELALSDGASVEQIRSTLAGITPGNKKPSPASEVLQLYVDEIRQLLNKTPKPLKPKSVWEVLRTRHELGSQVSYETFKRFVRSNNLAHEPARTTIRIELEGGIESQIDYAKMGVQEEPLTGKRLTVQAFIGVLSCSRLPFVQFVHHQTKASFIACIVAMFTFWGGVTKRLNLDNLKAGVLKADIYDPLLNHSLAEAADHYHFFVDPCRIASPTEKGKVERMVQTVRDQYQQLTALYPSATIVELNSRILIWCKDI